jgi:hypothetical protein
VTAINSFCDIQEFAKVVAAQTNFDGRFHSWYRMRLGFSDHLVSSLIDEFALGPESGAVLDPFCGAGTTLVECKKRQIRSVGIDANPASCFASRVKTSWQLHNQRLRSLLDEIEERFNRARTNYGDLRSDSTYQYLLSFGLIERGWICLQPLLEAIAIKHAIAELQTTAAYKNFFMLALISEVVEESSNIKFGPELYCGPKKNASDVIEGFVDRVEAMEDDIASLDTGYPEATVIHGDSRFVSASLRREKIGPIAAVICSPPYPAEHDYTRNTRLELAFLNEVTDKSSLQAIKRLMIRCHTKGIYQGDNDGRVIESNAPLKAIVDELEKRAQSKQHGFARLYGKVIQEYFGGMKKHFKSILPRLKDGACCAYVVGDQASYLGVHVPTAHILADLAEQVGLECVGIRKWRTRIASTTKRRLDENVLILRKSS